MKKRYFKFFYLFIFLLWVVQGCKEERISKSGKFKPFGGGAKLAKDFHTLMLKRYSFWEDRDDVETFTKYYQDNLEKFKNVDLSEFVELFRKWIENLTDQHLQIIFSNNSIIGTKQRENIKNDPPSIKLFGGIENLPKINLINGLIYQGGTYRNSSELSYGSYNNDIFYIRISSFSFPNKNYIKNYSIIFSSLFKEAAKKLENGQNKYKGIILDLRNNPGGRILLGNAFLNPFLIDKDLKYGCKKIRENKNSKAKKSKWISLISSYNVRKDNLTEFGDILGYSFDINQMKIPKDIPVAILVSKTTASQGEYSSAILRKRPRVKIYGHRTIGALSPVSLLNSSFRFEERKYNNLGMIVQMGQGVCRFRPEEGEKQGLRPDVEINEVIDQFNKAIEEIRNGAISNHSIPKPVICEN